MPLLLLLPVPKDVDDAGGLVVAFGSELSVDGLWFSSSMGDDLHESSAGKSTVADAVASSWDKASFCDTVAVIRPSLTSTTAPVCDDDDVDDMTLLDDFSRPVILEPPTPLIADDAGAGVGAPVAALPAE